MELCRVLTAVETLPKTTGRGAAGRCREIVNGFVRMRVPCAKVDYALAGWKQCKSCQAAMRKYLGGLAKTPVRCFTRAGIVYLLRDDLTTCG